MWDEYPSVGVSESSRTILGKNCSKKDQSVGSKKVRELLPLLKFPGVNLRAVGGNPYTKYQRDD